MPDNNSDSGSKKQRKDVDKVSQRSQSLDRICDDTNGDSRNERRNRRQLMHLVSSTHLMINKAEIHIYILNRDGCIVICWIYRYI